MTDQSILAAVSGVDANQTYLDAIANNIANANTVGYKNQDVVFQDMLAQQLSGASAPPASGGAGINPVSIGVGTQIAGDTVNLAEGSLQTTGNPNDLAINGNGYLVAVQNGVLGYTRNGSLTVDANGNLATHQGGLIQGWQANGAGVIDTNAPTTGVKIPTGETIPASATSSFALTGNLPAWNGVGTAPTASTTYDAYDALGNSIPVTLTFTGVSGKANEWSVQGSVTSPTGSAEQLWSTAPVISFDPASGQVSGVTIGTSSLSANGDGSYSIPAGTMPSGFTFPSGDTWNFNLPAPNASGAVTQFAGQQTIDISSTNGHPSGALESYSIGTNGVITGQFSNGTTLQLGQIALATFANPAGLIDNGNGMYSTSPNSGQASVGTPNTGGRGQLLGGQLEQSNVNLGSELTDLITAQESYDANTKVLTTTQTVLQALESAA